MQVPGYLCSWLALTGWRCALKSVRSANRLTADENGRTDRLTWESHAVLFSYLCVVSADIEEVEREDVVLGSHYESSSLLVQQEGVVGWTVGQAFKRHKVVGLQHFCRENWSHVHGDVEWKPLSAFDPSASEEQWATIPASVGTEPRTFLLYGDSANHHPTKERKLLAVKIICSMSYLFFQTFTF